MAINTCLRSDAKIDKKDGNVIRSRSTIYIYLSPYYGPEAYMYARFGVLYPFQHYISHIDMMEGS